MSAKGYIVNEKVFKLLLRDSGDYILLDKHDFEIAKHVAWWASKKGPINNQGVLLMDYVKLTGSRNQLAPLNDYRRKWYA